MDSRKIDIESRAGSDAELKTLLNVINGGGIKNAVTDRLDRLDRLDSHHASFPRGNHIAISE